SARHVARAGGPASPSAGGQETSADNQRAGGHEALQDEAAAYVRDGGGWNPRIEDVCHGSHPRRGKADRFDDALVTAATTDVPRHRCRDVIVRRLRRLREQGRCLHDLPGVTVAALRRAGFPPGDLHRMVALRIEPFDGDDLFAGSVARLDLAGTDGDAIEMHRAGAAQPGPTA